MIHVSVFLAAAAVGSIDTSGTSMLDELKKTLERRGMQVRAKAITLYSPCSELEESSECHGMNLVLNVLRSVVPFSDRAGEPWQRDDEEAGQLQGPGADRPRVDLPDGGEAVSSCDYVLHSHKPGVVMDSGAAHENTI